MDFRYRTIGCRRLEPVRPLPEAACIWWVGHARVQPGYEAFVHPVDAASIVVLIPLHIAGWFDGPSGSIACGDGDAVVLRGDQSVRATWRYGGATEADGILSLLVRGSWFVRAASALVERGGFRHRIGRPPLIRQLLREAARIASDPVRRPAADTFAEALALYDLLAHGSDLGETSRLEHVRQRLASAERLNIASLAQEVGWTREHLTRRFAAVHGLPPAAWQRRWLIQRAAAALADNRTSIKAVAADSGLPPDAFARLFRRLVGVSPSAYRSSPFPWA